MNLPPENVTRLTGWLKSLGLTKYEALVYIALMRVTSATASEIHESSGVPRASVYPVLDQLLVKDLVTVSQSAPKRFAAIPPEDAIKKLTARIETDARLALESLNSMHQQRIALEQEGGGELIWNIYGTNNIRKKLAELFASAKTDIRIIAQSKIFSEELRADLAKSADRVTVELVTPQWDGFVPPNMHLYVKARPCLPGDLERVKEMMAGGICIIDNRQAMVIVGSEEEDAVALYSESDGFVRFFTRYYSLIIEWAKRE
ncbi:MAG: TrmB family transcriptional regulator [Methanomicrobiales archaeon]|nr:TrmB family transcriptional regulator [Methanomicrobiales archaeon]